MGRASADPNDVEGLQPLENHGLWLAFHLFMIVRALVLGVVFVRIHRQRGFITRVI